MVNLKKLLLILSGCILFASCTRKVKVGIEVISQNGTEFKFSGFEIDGGPVMRWQWDFGVEGVDSDVSSIQNPEFKFPKAGKYTVHLYAHSRAGWGETTLTVDICPSEMSLNYSAECNSIVKFSLPEGIYKKTVQFDYGDGSTSSIENDTVSIFSHRYLDPSARSYIVRCTVSVNDCARSFPLEQRVDINIDPVADFEISKIGLEIDCTNLSIGEVREWLWDFGDGETSNERNPTHAYAIAGIYEVTLRAYGCSENNSMKVVTVNNLGILGAFQFPYAPNGIFPGTTRIIVDEIDYFRDGQSVKLRADMLQIYEPVRREMVDTVTPEPNFTWKGEHPGKHVAVVISKDRIRIGQGAITNTSDIVWAWNTHMPTGGIGRVDYRDGKQVINGEIQYDGGIPSPLVPYEFYYWTIYAWDDEALHVIASSHEFPLWIIP